MLHLIILLTFAAATAFPQTEAPLKSLFEFNRQNLIETGEKMPEHWYDYRPTPQVRSFREIYGHLLDALSTTCSKVRNQPGPVTGNLEQSRKQDLVDAARATFTFCEPAFAAPPASGENLRLLTTVLYHTGEHYGNLITYMRLRGLVPPHTEKQQQGAKPASAPAPKMVQYWMGFLKRGPNPESQPPAAIAEIQKNHLAHIRKMAETGKLVVAGPFGDDGEIRGILVFRSTDSAADLRALAEQDPAVKAGRLVLEIHPWWIQEHILP